MHLKTTAAAAFLIAASLAVASGFTACGSGNASQSSRLLTMAAEEAGFINSLQDRLTRQLNIADLQIQMNEKGEAIKTLKLAMTTLKAKDPADTSPSTTNMDDFRQIAGWTSIAQLSHRAGDNALGCTAYVEAVEVLHSVKPEAKRAEYVLSLSQVAFELKGKEEASRLLVNGGKWSQTIADTTARRFALTTFTQQLITYDNLDDARTVMRNEPDPAWRSDTLTAMAQISREKDTMAKSSSFAASRAPIAPAADTRIFMNQNIKYEDTYKQADLQSGMMPK